MTTAGRNTAGDFVVRVAGLPTSVLAGLRCERTWAHLRQVLALRRWLDAEGAALSEMLFGLIGQSPPEFKAVLVALRRAVFTGRHRGPAPGLQRWPGCCRARSPTGSRVAGAAAATRGAGSDAARDAGGGTVDQD